MTVRVVIENLKGNDNTLRVSVIDGNSDIEQDDHGITSQRVYPGEKITLSVFGKNAILIEEIRKQIERKVIEIGSEELKVN